MELYNIWSKCKELRVSITRNDNHVSLCVTHVGDKFKAHMDHLCKTKPDTYDGLFVEDGRFFFTFSQCGDGTMTVHPKLFMGKPCDFYRVYFPWKACFGEVISQSFDSYQRAIYVAERIVSFIRRFSTPGCTFKTPLPHEVSSDD